MPHTSSGHQISPSRYSTPGIRSSGEEGRAVEVDDVAQLAEDEGRRHGEAGADHVADHHAEPEPARLRGHQQRLGEAAALVELDVDDVEAADQPGTSASAEHAFVGGDRDRACEAVEIGFAPARQRLLEQRDALRDHAPRPARSSSSRVEALVGIDAEPDVGPRRRAPRGPARRRARARRSA